MQLVFKTFNILTYSFKNFVFTQYFCVLVLKSFNCKRSLLFVKRFHHGCRSYTRLSILVKFYQATFPSKMFLYGLCDQVRASSLRLWPLLISSKFVRPFKVDMTNSAKFRFAVSRLQISALREVRYGTPKFGKPWANLQQKTANKKQFQQKKRPFTKVTLQTLKF